QGDQANQENKSKDNEANNSNNDGEPANDEQGTTTHISSDDEAFAVAEYDMKKARSKLIDDYTATVASETATAEEQAEANKKINQIKQLSAKESILESLIVAKGYDDALVNAQGHEVQDIVKADELAGD